MGRHASPAWSACAWASRIAAAASASARSRSRKPGSGGACCGRASRRSTMPALRSLTSTRVPWHPRPVSQPAPLAARSRPGPIAPEHPHATRLAVPPRSLRAKLMRLPTTTHGRTRTIGVASILEEQREHDDAAARRRRTRIPQGRRGRRTAEAQGQDDPRLDPARRAPAYKLGKEWRIRRDDFDQAMQARRTVAEPAPAGASGSGQPQHSSAVVQPLRHVCILRSSPRTIGGMVRWP